MRRWFLALLLLLPLARAHYVTEHALQGARLCLDESSVQVEVHGDGSQPDALLASIMQRRLRQSLTHFFGTYHVPHEERESCAGSPDFVLLHLLVYHLSAMGLRVTDDYPYTYTASLQVGQHVTGVGLEVENTLPGARYNVIESYIYSEALTGEPFHAALPARSEAMLHHLVGAWWLDNPVTRPGSRLPQRLGAVLALLTLAVLLVRLGRARASLSPGARLES